MRRKQHNYILWRKQWTKHMKYWNTVILGSSSIFPRTEVLRALDSHSHIRIRPIYELDFPSCK